MCICTATLFATSPDRILVRETGTQNIKGFLAERVDSIFFDKIEGEVVAKISDLKYDDSKSGPSITMSITRSEACEGFRVCVFPPSARSYLYNEPVAIAYAEMYGSEIYFEDFEKGVMTGFDDLTPGVVYSVVTVGYDKYGIACSIDKASFETPSAEIVGNPHVEAEVVSVDYKKFSIKFTPNEDVSEYYLCSFYKGEIESQFDMYSAWMGFNSYSEMIAKYSQVSYDEEYTNTWSGMVPGTDYEVYIAMKDKNGNFAPNIFVPVTTKSYGGPGEAKVEIEIGEYVYDTQAAKYKQHVVFTPNEDTAFFRDILIDASYYGEGKEWDDAKVIEYLSTDNPFDPNYGNMYGVDDDYWELEPGSEFMAFALAKNANREWGPLCSKRFSTPALDANKAAKSVKLPKRIGAKAGETQGISVPNMGKVAASPKKLQLTHK